VGPIAAANLPAGAAISAAFTMGQVGNCPATDITSIQFVNFGGGGAFQWWLTNGGVQVWTWNYIQASLPSMATDPLFWQALWTMQWGSYVGGVWTPDPTTGTETPVGEAQVGGATPTGAPVVVPMTLKIPGSLGAAWGYPAPTAVSRVCKFRMYAGSTAQVGAGGSFGTLQSGWSAQSGNTSSGSSWDITLPVNAPSLDMGQVNPATVASSIDAAAKNITLTGITGTYSVGDAVTGHTSGATGTAASYNSTAKVVGVMSITGTFAVGELLNDSTSGASGTISAIAAIMSVAKGGIKGVHAASATFTGGNLAANTVTGGASGNIALTTVTGGNLGSLTVTGGTSGNLVLATVTGGNLGTQTVTGGTSGNVALSTVVGGNLASQTVSGTNVVNQTITYTQVGSNTLTGGASGNVASSTLTGSNVAGTTITGSNVATYTLLGGVSGSPNIAYATLTGGNLTTLTVTGGSTGNIASLTVVGSNIGNQTIVGGNLTNGTITYSQIGSYTITGSNIASLTITDSNIASMNVSKLVAGSASFSGTVTFTSTTGGTVAIGGGLVTITGTGQTIYIGTGYGGSTGLFCSSVYAQYFMIGTYSAGGQMVINNSGTFIGAGVACTANGIGGTGFNYWNTSGGNWLYGQSYTVYFSGGFTVGGVTYHNMVHNGGILTSVS
jgi:hypothetical protein